MAGDVLKLPGRLQAGLFPTFSTVVTGTALGWALFGVGLFRHDGDVGRHVRVGNYILETGSIPRMDLFSHTMYGQPFVPYEWLSEVIFAAADRAAGLAGIAVLAGLLFSATCLVVFRFGRLTGAGPLMAASVAVLAMVLQAVHLLPRPHLFTTLFAAVFLLLLEAWRQQPRWRVLALTVPLMVLWTNLHGGFLVGFVILGVYLADAWRPRSPIERYRRPLLVATLGCLLATFINPVGAEIWSHTLSYFGIQFLVDQTNEYQSPDFHQLYGRLFLIAIVLGFGMLGSGRTRSGFRDLLLFLGWLAAGLTSARNIPLFGVLAVPWYGTWAVSALRVSGKELDDGWGDWASRILRLDTRAASTEAGIAGVLPTLLVTLLLATYALSSGRDRYQFDPTSFPVAATEALGGLGIRGPVFNEMPWGGFLLYARRDIPVFIDGQTDFYGEALSRDYLRIRQLAPGALALLDDYRIGWILIPRTIPLPQALSLDPSWSLVYEDAVALVFKRIEDLP